MAFLACFRKNNRASVVCALLASACVCRTFILISFHLCRYVLKHVTWESGEGLWGLMGQVQHAPLAP